MLEALETLLDFFKSIWDVVVMLFEGLLDFFELLATLPEKITGYLSFLPPEILGAVVGGMAIVIIYKIVGRD